MIHRIWKAAFAVAALVIGPAWVNGAAATVGVNFAGGSGSNFAPPDTDGAVGLNDYTQFINGRFAVYSKTGSLRLATSDTTFWNSAGILSTTTSAGLSDTRVLWDPLSSRWFATEINVSTTGNQVLVARSDGTDPAGTWKATQFTGNSGFADYPTLGVDANGVYIGTVNFTNGTSTGSNHSTSMTSIPKANILAATPSVASRTTVEQTGYDMGYVLQGVTNFAASPTHATVVSANAFNYGQLNITQITNTNTASPTFGTTKILNVASTNNPGLMHQPDGTQLVDGGDDRIGHVTYQVGDRIYVVHAVSVNSSGVATTSGAGTTNGIRVTVLSDSGQNVITEGTYFNPSYDYSYPSISANSNGDIVIGFTRSGAAQGSGSTTGNLSAGALYATLSNSNVLTFQNEMLLQAGLVNNYHLFSGSGDRWGDFSQSSPDPSNSNSFWVTEEYAAGTGTWGTYVAQVTVPEPGTLAMMSIGALLLLRRRTVAC